MFNRDSNTYTTNKNFGHETGQDAHKPQLESRRETEGESPNLKTNESERKTPKPTHSKHPSLSSLGIFNRPAPLEAHSINNQANLAKNAFPETSLNYALPCPKFHQLPMKIIMMY